ncbi:hypothetical protein A3O11_03045 [Ligilactobacillus aviarius]|uniref:flavodoxin family protein n=1 Tax=Ligilactobacillus aviarius TaxID=1606 RepID=UPI0007D984D3|nr:NAD(P)H-dependent oxidoreductase [Ligilactobacillus aviarius]OAQ03686.1 hypothetical protein A3O10_00100 [Ligilactobacillus aviarius]OAQ05655.1 hypothetical protein A3O11_03045 [Ligilactobacillus aviarius]OAS79276.1 hypothetical protein A3O18_00255 [Ligilactobacillus aviarius]PEG71239.1 NADPH-dependent oxidoreductase [Ligilactobacillus aviarius]PEG74511.1 NADPH-dependent oxidoreductase [Ligilactobacillus aviarius]
MEKILFINASEYDSGNTSRLGHENLNGIDYDQLNLVDYKIFQLGQHFDDDQFEEVISKMKIADTWVICTPVYWHNMSGRLKVWLDRMSEYPHSMWYGKKLVLGVQGMEPSDTIGPMRHLMKRFCDLNQMEFLGEATTNRKIKGLNHGLKKLD